MVWGCCRSGGGAGSGADEEGGQEGGGGVRLWRLEGEETPWREERRAGSAHPGRLWKRCGTAGNTPEWRKKELPRKLTHTREDTHAHTRIYIHTHTYTHSQSHTAILWRHWLQGFPLNNNSVECVCVCVCLCACGCVHVRVKLYSRLFDSRSRGLMGWCFLFTSQTGTNQTNGWRWCKSWPEVTLVYLTQHWSVWQNGQRAHHVINIWAKRNTDRRFQKDR